jgi:hypothetical protein
MGHSAGPVQEGETRRGKTSRPAAENWPQSVTPGVTVAATVHLQYIYSVYTMWLQYKPNSMKMVFSTNGVGSF